MADQHRHDVARARHDRQAGLSEAALEPDRALLMTLAFGLALFEVAYRGKRPCGDGRRQ